MSARTSLLILVTAIALVSLLPAGAPFGRIAAAAVDVSAQAGRQGMQMDMSMQDMMKMHEKMMADQKSSQAKLDELAKAMNSATGDAKVTAMAALLNELVRQHRAMGDHMGTMHQHMMKMGK